MKIAVCDDCYEDAQYLKTFLKKHEVKLYPDAACLLADLRDSKQYYDLYLLDIFMENSINGIDLAEKLRTMDESAVICFISSSDAFYREAYDLYAIQYLLKPVQAADLEQLLERVSQNTMKGKEQNLQFKWRGETGLIPYGNILYINSREHTLFIHCRDGSVQPCKGKLNELELHLHQDIFSRCHQSFLVNMYHVDSLNGNDLYLSGDRIPISRRYYNTVKKRYQEILFEVVN